MELFTNRFTSKNSRAKKQAKATTLIKLIRERKQANDHLKEKLISMLEGNRVEAERLVAKQRFGREGKYSENYCWWLAIRDLEEQHKKKMGNAHPTKNS